MCDISSFYFSPFERACGDCEDYEQSRNLSEKQINLWKLLVYLDRPVAIHSLPEQYIGCLGILLKHKLIEIYTGKVYTVSIGQNMALFSKEKFVEIIRRIEYGGDW
jgi:hypothetical protein